MAAANQRRDRGRFTVGRLCRGIGHPLDRDSTYVDPTGQLIVLPDPCSIRGQAARAWLDRYLADNEDAAGRLPHERTPNHQEAA